MLTYGQSQWGDTSGAAASLLSDFYDVVYGSMGGLFEVGIPGGGGFSMLFSDALSVGLYLPAVGTAGPLVSDLLNPTSSSSGAYGGHVVSLALNVDFSDDNLIAGSVAFGDLSIWTGKGVGSVFLTRMPTIR